MVAWFAARDAFAVRDYIALLDESGTLAPDSLPLRRSVPSAYADTRTWVRYALAIDEGGPWRVRRTEDDNAPRGREVHWNSAFAHLIAYAGRMRHDRTGEPVGIATERALAWFNLPLFLMVVVLFSGWTARRAGAAGGVLLAFGMLGSRWFYDGFAPNYVDHHGLLSAASFGVALGVLFMGAGWYRPHGEGTSLLPTSREDARAGAVASGIAGGFGMWISAASTIPTIAIVGLAGVLAMVWFGPRAESEHAGFDADLWRLWGRVGCATALVAYLIEYAPSHFGMRLEVNHPLYAFAWLGGGELIAMIGETRVSKEKPPLWRVVTAIIVVLAPAIVIVAAGPSAVFIPGMPRMARLHDHIEEFLSLPAVFRVRGAAFGTRFVQGFVLLLPCVLVVRSRQRDRVIIAYAAITATVCVLLACWQSRWWLMASGPELSLLLVGVAAIAAERSERIRWSLVLGICVAFLWQSDSRIRVNQRNVANGAVTIADALQPLYRDIAAAFRASQPTGEITVLASPDASTGIGYYGRFKTIGTLYWENLEGLDAAAAMFTARTDDEARTLLAARHVTHVAVVSHDDFLDAYVEFAHRDATHIAAESTFMYRLEHGALPHWLKPIPIPVRAKAVSPTLVVFALQIVPDQTDFEQAWSIGAAEVASGDTLAADAQFRRAIANAPLARAADLYAKAGAESYRWSAHGLAVGLLREAMRLDPATPSQVSLAWIMATSVDRGVRDGRAALAIIAPLAQRSASDPTLLEVYAAAFAETGDFANASRIEAGVLNDAREHQGIAAQTRALERLTRYRAGQPWRQ